MIATSSKGLTEWMIGGICFFREERPNLKHKHFSYAVAPVGAVAVLDNMVASNKQNKSRLDHHI